MNSKYRIVNHNNSSLWIIEKKRKYWFGWKRIDCTLDVKEALNYIIDSEKEENDS